jgi:hypothetical protein
MRSLPAARRSGDAPQLAAFRADAPPAPSLPPGPNVAFIVRCPTNPALLYATTERCVRYG